MKGNKPMNKTLQWEKKISDMKQEERFRSTLEFLFDASRGEKQVFLEELAKLFSEALQQERERLKRENEMLKLHYQPSVNANFVKEE